MSADRACHSGTTDDRITPFPYWIISFDGTKLRQRRRERGLSQERLSYRSRVSLGTIQRVEKLSVASCHVGTLQRLTAALSPDQDALISELTEDFSDSPRVRIPRGPLPRPRADLWWQRAKPFPADKTERGRYDAAMARELLAMTSEFPDSKGGMLTLLNEYRHALYDIATETASASEAGTPCKGTCVVRSGRAESRARGIMRE